MIFFIFSRAADILTTYLAIRSGGIGLEANFLMRSLMAKGFIYFILWQILLILAVGCFYRRYRLMRVAVWVVSWVGIVVAISNFVGFVINT